MTAGIDDHSAAGRDDRVLPPPQRPVIVVVIPAYNEEGAVRATVQDVGRILGASCVAHRIIVVDDGSSDATGAEARAAGAQVIEFPDNTGYGHALKAGIAASESELVAILDADGTYPPGALPAMIAMAAHADMVVGDRGAAMNNVPWVRRPAKWVLKMLASLVAQRRINDVNSGLRVFRRASLERFIPLLPDGYSFTTTITLCMLATSLTVVYHPISYGRRVGRSKIRPRHFLRFLFLVVRLTVFFQPLRIFLPLGALLFAGGLAMAVNDDHLSARAVFALMAAVIVAALGFVADMLARLNLGARNPRGRGGAA